MGKYIFDPTRRANLDRRTFLRLSGLLGLGTAAAAVCPAAAEAVKFDRRAFKVSQEKWAIGTRVSITAVDASRDKAEDAIGRAFDEITRLSKLFNRFEDSTAVGTLNREGLLEDVPPEMTLVVGAALDYYRLTGGLFDITVKPVIDLFRSSYDAGQALPPPEREFAEALSLVGSSAVRLSPGIIKIDREGAGITLDGIAKGFIVDRVSGIMTGAGVRNHLVNAGGDIRTSGSKGSGGPWTVAIQDPGRRAGHVSTIRMGKGAVATSGNYEVYFDREKMFHHIIDPSSGYSPFATMGASVRSNTAMEADALSTALFVMGSERAVKFAGGVPSCECLIVKKGGRVFTTPGWRNAAI
ncbi:MAG: FAD:protein FMN transferase [Desulfatiglandaceae bacterium]